MDGTFCAHVLLATTPIARMTSLGRSSVFFRRLDCWSRCQLGEMAAERSLCIESRVAPRSNLESRDSAWLGRTNRLDGLLDVTLTISRILVACTYPQGSIRSGIERRGCPLTGGFGVDFWALNSHPFESPEAVLGQVEPDLLDRGWRVFGP